jgi:hypothetical protein
MKSQEIFLRNCHFSVLKTQAKNRFEASLIIPFNDIIRFFFGIRVSHKIIMTQKSKF